MKLNQKLIEQLRNGEIAAENNGTVEQLREVLKAAFPENGAIPTGYCQYYLQSGINTCWWTVSTFHNIDLPTLKISDFYESELFTGWAKDDDNPKWIVYFKNDVAKFGFDAYGAWTKWGVNRYAYSEDPGNRPATHEEIETTLTKEAKRRGYKGGDTIKGIHGTSHIGHEIISFTYDSEDDTLLTNEDCIVYEAGKWAEIIEQPKAKPKTNPIHYTVGGTTYSFNYQELKAEYDNVVNLTDESFMKYLPQIAHLACVVAYFKGLGSSATISDKGIIHELIHLMTDPDEPTNDLAEIRNKFEYLIWLV